MYSKMCLGNSTKSTGIGSIWTEATTHSNAKWQTTGQAAIRRKGRCEQDPKPCTAVAEKKKGKSCLRTCELEYNR